MPSVGRLDSLLIIQPGSKLPSLAPVAGDFASWVCAGMGIPFQTASVVRPHLGETLPEPGTLRAVVITGSSAMVTDREPWIERSAHWLGEAAAREIPMLGICFGHQLIAHALGGLVRDNPHGVEVGTVPVQLFDGAASNLLFRGLPARMQLHVSHRQSVIQPPAGVAVLAGSEREAVQAFAVGERIWGLQFHPEFTARIVGSYVDYYARGLLQEGRDPDLLRRQVSESPVGRRLLRRFAEIAGLSV